MSCPGTIVCDLDGVVYLGNELIPGADRAIEALRTAGWHTVFCTNNSSRTPDQAAEKLSRLTGLSIMPEETVSSAQAAASVLAGEVDRAYVLGGPGVHGALDAVGVEVVSDWRHAEAVVVGLDTGLTYESLRDAALAVRAGAWFVATNLDPAFPTPDGLWPGAGAVVAAVAATCGQEPLAAGKPFLPMIELLRSRIDTEGPTLVIGDRPSTDLAMGKAAGWLTAGVLTGVIDDASEIPTELTPDVLLPSIAGLPKWLGDHLEREMV